MLDGAPLFSIVIPTRDRPQALRQCVTSVLGQPCDDFELVVVDDGSRQPAEGALSAVRDPRLRVVRQEHAGPSSARNAGLHAAGGRFIVFLDDDDEPYPNWLTTLAAAFSGSNADVVCCAYEESVVEKGVSTVKRPRALGPLFDGATGLFMPGAFAASRDLLLRCGGYEPELAQGENFELGMRLCSASREVRTSDVPILRHHRSLARQRTRDAGRIESVSFLLQRYDQVLREHPAELAKWLSIRGVSRSRIGDAAGARRDFWRAALSRPRVPQVARLGVSCVPPLARTVWRRQELRSND